MSRSDYCDDLDTWALIRWRGAVASATRGARGQTLLRELLEALDAMPQKELIAHEVVKHSVGEYVRGQAHTNGVEHVLRLARYKDDWVEIISG